MAEFDVGQTFVDLKSTNLFMGTKPKYFIALSSAEYDNDDIICFVMNTEKRVELYNAGCNKPHNKYLLKPSTFSFITNYTSIMLNQPTCYKLIEMYYDNIKILDRADELLCRQIKNCIDWDYIPLKFALLIKKCFK